MNYWKLIELLNEFDKPLGWYYEDWVLDCKLNLYEYMAYEWICSARYWFIKWLVENDKIDIDAYKTVYSGDLDKRKTLTMSSGWDEFYQVTEHWAYESLLMLLSISNSPIDLLCSVLK